MSIEPKVSIILTCFNQGKYLIDSIGSVMGQSYSNWECLIIDDGSTDNTQEIAKSFYWHDERIQYYFQQNSGVSIARNFGIEKSKGDFIHFLDADDKLHTQKLQYQVHQLESNPNIDLIYGSSRYFFDSNPEVLYPMHFKGAIPCDLTWKDSFQVEMLLNNNICTNCSMLLRRSVVEKVKFRQLIYEDWLFNLECALNNFVFHFDNSPFAYSYIRMTDSSQMIRHTNDIFKLEQFQAVLAALVKEYNYPLDMKIFTFENLGLSGKIKKAFRLSTPPLIYSFLGYLKRKLLF